MSAQGPMLVLGAGSWGTALALVLARWVGRASIGQDVAHSFVSAAPARGATLAGVLTLAAGALTAWSIAPKLPAGDEPRTMVLWKARVLRTGDFPLSIRASTGVTQTRLISITKNG